MYVCGLASVYHSVSLKLTEWWDVCQYVCGNCPGYKIVCVWGGTLRVR